MKKYIRLLLLIYLLPMLSLQAQVNFEPIEKSIYNYLERLSTKGIIQLNEEILPFSRIYLAQKLIEIDNNKNSLTSLEKDELIFFINEYAHELKKLDFDLSLYETKNKIVDLNSDILGFDNYNRFRLISFDKKEFGFFVDPIFGYNYEIKGDKNSILWSNGLRLYGYIGNNLGFDLQFFDNHFRGDYFDRNRRFSPYTGFEFKVGKNDGFDFDRMNANLTYAWKWGNVSLSKDFNYYGTGENGNIILSNKAPSFPNLKLEVNPINWFRFSYILGSLNSRIIDSAEIRPGPLRDHFSKVEKYFVSHFFSFTPLKSMNISIGESVIYSDKFEPIYLIPISFFRLADHYLTDPDEAAGNAQLFASFWYKNYWSRTKFFGSIFIDELSLGNSKNPKAIAYNIGLKSIDIIIPESEIIIEYSKLDPFIYFHADEAQTFENYGYQLGHWIGSNADQIYVKIRKRILRGLNFDFIYSYIRKGEEETFDESRYQEKHKFLWGLNNIFSDYTIEINYELLHDFYLKINYRYLNTSSEISDGKFVKLNNNFISTSLNYGL